MFLRQFPRSCRGLPPKSVSGVYKIQPLPNIDPIEVYCEMAVGGGGFIFLPRTITKTRGAQKIVNFLFRDMHRKRVLLKLQRKNDRSESYTLIQPHPNFTKYSFKILVNSYSGYTKPKNHYMSDYFFLGIIPAAKARRRGGTQGFKSNGRTIQFRNCDANPNSFFAFMPNHELQTPSGYHPNLVYERSGVAVNWRSTAITNHHQSWSYDAQSVLLSDRTPFWGLPLQHFQKPLEEVRFSRDCHWSSLILNY